MTKDTMWRKWTCQNCGHAVESVQSLYKHRKAFDSSHDTFACRGYVMPEFLTLPNFPTL